MYRAWELAVGVLAFAGCTTVTNAPASAIDEGLDETVFRCKAEPVLVRQCSYLACHGNADSALRVYSPGKLRAQPPADSTAANADLTDAEHHANFLSAAGLSFETLPIDNWLLRKPLPSSLGGFEHLGGAIYAGTNDAQYVAIEAWLAGGTSCN